MDKTKLSSKGQVIIPKSLRTSHHWEPGQEFIVIDLEDGILLKSTRSFPETRIEEVASCLKYQGKVKTQQDMDAAIREAIQSKFK